jgi:serralysin
VLNLTKPTYTEPQIITQLTTSWGQGYTHTESWALSSISYSISTTAPTNFGSVPTEASGLVTMTAHERASAELAFTLWDDLIPNRLVETSSAAANITFNYSSNTGGGTYSEPKLGYSSATHDRIAADQIWIASGWASNQSAAITAESYGMATYIHEIGHSLGLSHPGTYDASQGSVTYATDAVYATDNRQYSIMSYFGGYDPVSQSWHQDGTSNSWYYPDTPMVDDVAAIQYLYGADYATRATDTVYGFNSSLSVSDPERAIFDFSSNPHAIFTIWDGGGNDTIDASGYSANQTIDLGPGHYSSIGGMNGNIGIAYGAVVENAIGGSGNDVILGNDANNVLAGGAGADRIDGGQGFNFASYSSAGTGVSVDESYAQYNSGDARGDTFVNIQAIVGSSFDDGLFGSAANDVVYAGAGNDTIYGRAGNDVILGNSGNDVMVGGAGDDVIYGSDYISLDHDRFVFEAGDFGHDVIQGFSAEVSANQDVLQIDHTHFASFSAVMAHAAQMGTDVVITDGAANSIDLVAVTLSHLSASDFLFV